jgi:dethiobiotin synthetase
MQGLFVTGTDTDVGKTWITCLIASHLRSQSASVGVYKPACSGSQQEDGHTYWSDIRALSAATGDQFATERICPQRFHAPLAPPVAASEEGKEVDADLLRRGIDWWSSEVENLLAEGVGGLLCPLTESEVVADLAVATGFPILIVARAGLGTINHTLLTIEAAKARGLAIAGVVLNHATTDSIEPTFVASNARQITDYGNVRVLGFCDYNSSTIVNAASGEPIVSDWLSLFGCAE